MVGTIRLHFYGASAQTPTLELKDNGEQIQTLSFQPARKRQQGEFAWVVEFRRETQGAWQFRIDLGNHTYACPYQGGSFDWFETSIDDLWVQDGQIYAYPPAPFHTLSQVVKIPGFVGSLPKRPLYVYLPRGYDQHTFKTYPVIYMHDGQNCFERWVQDSYAGSWRADQAADYLIATGRMRECIIVGVGNSPNDRIPEYLPPNAVFDPKKSEDGSDFTPIRGRASETAQYYQHEVVQFIETYYRAMTDRRQRATCGSSMGGLFSLYLAKHHADFAQHHAVMSPSLWITGDAADGYAQPRMIDDLRTAPPRNVRIWLDSGTKYSHHHGDDGMYATMAARDVLLENGYTLGHDLGYYLHQDAIHNEQSWAERLPNVFQFLFPFVR